MHFVLDFSDDTDTHSPILELFVQKLKNIEAFLFSAILVGYALSRIGFLRFISLSASKKRNVCEAKPKWAENGKFLV